MDYSHLDYKGYRIAESYSHPDIKGGYKFSSLNDLLAEIDDAQEKKGLAKQKIEAKFIMCQVPQGVCAARYCVETGEISFSDFGEWKVGKGHIYE